MHRGEQGRREDAESEAAETGAATPHRSPASETISELPPPQQHRTPNGMGAGSPNHSGLAGADVSLHGDDSPPPAGASGGVGSTGRLAAVPGISSAPDVAPGSGAPAPNRELLADASAECAGDGSDGQTVISTAGAEHREIRTAEFGAGGGSGGRQGVSLMGSSDQAIRSSSINPLFEPEPQDAGHGGVRESNAEPRPHLEDEEVASACGSADIAPVSLSDGMAGDDGSGEVRVRRQVAQQHPSILRQSTWGEAEVDPKPDVS